MKKHKKYRLKPRIKKVLLSSVMILTIAVLGIVLSNNGTNILNSVKNYFAAGDVQANTYKQVPIAIGNGYTAGMRAFEYLSNKQ